MESINSFKKAAQDFQKDQLYLNYVEAKKANDADEALQKSIGEFNLMRMNLNAEMEKDKEEQDQNKINEINQKLNQLFNEIMTNPNMMAYNQAKDEIESFINYVNDVLNAAIMGEDPLMVEPSASGCSSDCSSCSGCS